MKNYKWWPQEEAENMIEGTGIEGRYLSVYYVL